MKRLKPWLITLAILGVVSVYAYIYRDWFKSPTIQIFHRIAAPRPARPDANRPKRNKLPANTPTVVFGLDRKITLTRVKVFNLTELATNAAAVPIWHLVISSNAFPIKGFMYGERIRGMQPYVNGARPWPLESNLTYRLVIEAGSKTGQHDFSLGGKTPSPTTASK